MNLLLLDQFSAAAGAQLCLRDLIPEMRRRGWNLHLMAPGNGELIDYCLRLELPVHPLPLRNYGTGQKSARDWVRFALEGPRAAAAVRTVVREHRIEAIYVNGPRVLPVVVNVRAPIIFHAHSIATSAHSRSIARWVLRRTKAPVIAASEFIARSYGKPDSSPSEVIYNGVPDTGFSFRSFSLSPARIGIIGRIAPEKGQRDFVRTARLIRDAKFFIYGASLHSDPSYAVEVRKMAEGMPVEFRGWTDDIAEALRHLDILAVPSNAVEASTRVIMEAFAAGTPVVAYPSGGIPEIVAHGRTGILTEAAHYESLACAITGLLKDPDRMKRLAAAGREEWQRRFTVDAFRKRVCDFVGSCAAGSRLEPCAQVAVQQTG